jgi:hypothetical protein
MLLATGVLGQANHCGGILMDLPSIHVPTRLRSPHPLIIAAQAQLEAQQFERDGLVQARGCDAIKIAVTRGNVGRALRIMDTFVKEMLTREFILAPRQNQLHPDVALEMAGRKYPIRLREHIRKHRCL